MGLELTSTFHPSFFIKVHSSLDVLTFPLSTAVQVGRMAPSPLSAASVTIESSRLAKQASILTNFVMCEQHAPVSEEKYV